MTDLDAIEYIEELKKFNAQDKMITPHNKELGFDTFYQCAFDHAIAALKSNMIPKDTNNKIDNLDDIIKQLKYKSEKIINLVNHLYI